MLPDRVSNPGPLTYESGALPIALRGPAQPRVCNSAGCRTNNIYSPGSDKLTEVQLSMLTRQLG